MQKKKRNRVNNKKTYKQIIRRNRDEFDISFEGKI